MLAQLIQKEIPINSKVIFSLKSGREVTGVLIEIGRDHIKLQRNGNYTTIPLERIDMWEVLEDVTTVFDGQTADSVTSSRADSLPYQQGDDQISVQAESLADCKEVGIQPVGDENEMEPAIHLEQPTLGLDLTDIETITDISETEQLATSNEKEQRSKPFVEEANVFRKILEIETCFKIQLQNTRMEVRPPDLSFPSGEFKGRNKTDAEKIWQRVSNRYQHAVKMNELSVTFGRIQSIIDELKTLVSRVPNSANARRLLAYCYWISGNPQEALKYYKDTAQDVKKPDDWYNFAALALKTKQDEMACLGLDQFFHQVPITTEINAWYIYIGLLVKFSNYPALANLYRTVERNLLEEELLVLWETEVYLLKVIGEEQKAVNIVRRSLEGESFESLVLEVFNQFSSEPDEVYQQAETRLREEEESKRKQSLAENSHKPQGCILTYFPDRRYGFLRDTTGEEYFFHRSAVVDDKLLAKIEELRRDEQILVVFETAQSPKGALAVGVSLYRTVEEMFDLAVNYANDGEYPKAIAQVKKVLALNPLYPSAQEYYERWREYARSTGVPRGSNPYARAKRVELIEKDPERAINLFQIAIKQNDNVESAIKDMSALLVRLDRADEAIDVLQKNRSKISNQQSIDNMLVGFYQKADQHERAIELLTKKLNRTSTDAEKVGILWQIAKSYLRQEDYAKAEQNFRAVYKIQPDNITTQRNIAICLFKQQCLDEAEDILNQILDTSPDAKSAELLEAIIQSKTTGQSIHIDEIIIETASSDFSGEISGFTQFFLERCDFQGVPPDRVQKQEFNRFDIQKLEERATQLGTRLPRDRSGFYLSAAKIISILEEGGTSDQFYKYLCRSFASKGDACVIERRPLDVARELYCEALAVYYVNRGKNDQQDAVNALVRFLFATLGQSYIPIEPHIPTIDETIEKVFSLHPQKDMVFDAIAYLVLRSRYAAQRILNRLFTKSTLQAMALEYLKKQGISPRETIKQPDFVRLWNELSRKSLDKLRNISSELRFVRRVELTTASLENSIKRVKGISDHLLFELDQQRVGQLQQILETAFDLCKQTTFEEKERLCIQIDNRCQDLLKEIEDNPTKISVEELFLIVESIQKKTGDWLTSLYESSTPQLSLRLPVESYSPDKNHQIEVQVVSANRIGCSPAESLKLVIAQGDDTILPVGGQEIGLDGSLRGGDQQILKIPIHISDQAMQFQTFSLPVYAQYSTRSGDICQTAVSNFSIRLYSEADFEEIEDNPYALYAEGGIVDDPNMFYGREGLIETASQVIQRVRFQGKCMVVFGQKRAGKSSVLHHLKKNLEKNNDILVLDLGNIGSILDDHSDIPLLYQILWSIISKLKYAIEDREEDGWSTLNLSLVEDNKFFKHPSPLILFKDTFETFRRRVAKVDGWEQTRVVLLIDEFSYIYGQIVSRRIPEDFMKNWKALLQENYFSVVLVGQDVMPKFKQRFPNEFGTTQDERVSYLRREDAIRLIDEPIRIGGIHGESRYRERAIERILDLTAGSPFYIQIICNRLVEYMNRKRAKLVTDADVEQVKYELVRGVNALGLDKFDNLINSGDTSEDAISDEDALKVLKAIAVNSQIGGYCSRSGIVCETKTRIAVILDDLVKREVIERDRSHYYRIRVSLFKEWLVANQ